MKKLKVNDIEEDEEDENDYDAGVLKIEKVGSLLRHGQDKVAHISIDENEATAKYNNTVGYSKWRRAGIFLTADKIILRNSNGVVIL